MNKFTTKSALVAGLVAVAFAFTAVASAATFSTNLKQGSTGADVKSLQQVLNSSADTQVASVGAGSPGMETSYFGPATKAAVIKFQNKYASEVLTPAGLTSGTGFVGALTRAKLNTMGGSTTTTTGSSSTVPGCTSTVGFSPTTGQSCATGVATPAATGTGVAVAAATQPANGLAIKGSSRVPFTKFTLTAGSSDVVVNGVTVERTGAAVDAVFAGVVLLDEDGTQLDIAKTFGSTHQAIVGGTFTVKAGTSKTFTVAGNMASSLTSQVGQVASVSVVAVNTTATVSGSLPIVGASHTMNDSLTIGTATGANSSYDPGATATKAIGTTGYKFTAVRLSAGSAEDIRLKSVRFYQAGSVSASDLANVKIYVDGTAYDTTVSDRYYTANFGSGIVIAKGLAKDIWIAGDIVGSGSAARTIDFDIQKNTDVYVTGETYGQGIIAGGTITTSTPSLSGYAVTISAGSFTLVQKSTSVPAQNIAINLAGQALGGYDVDLTGESISVQSHVFTVTNSGASNVGNVLTSVSLYNENGAVVAGPVDAVSTGATTQTITFTDTVTYPVGKHTYSLKGKVDSDVVGGVTYSTVLTSMSNITGQTTGNTISSPTVGFAMNTMTVKAAALAISMSTTPAAQNIVAGSQGVTFANLQFDASQSGEDVRFSSIVLTAQGTGDISKVSGLQLFDGEKALNTGSNVVTSATSTTITFDQTLTVAKNTVKTLALKGNLSSSAANTFRWNVATAPTTTGVISGATVSVTGAATANSAIMTVAAGSLAVSTSASSPSYAIAAAGSTGNIAGVYTFRASNESINLSRIALKLTNTASSSSSDLVQVSIWDGATQVGTAVFTGTNTTATSTLSSVVTLPKDTDKDLTVKVDFAQIGSGYTGVQGDLIAVDINSTDSTGTEGTGVGSGATVDATGSTAVSGIRLFKSFPTFALDTLSGTGVADGVLMKFKVTANSNGPIGINQFNFTIATSTITNVSAVNLFVYTDAGYSSPASGFASGQIDSSNQATGAAGAVTITPSAVVRIPAGATYYFKLTGTVAGVQTGSSVTTTLLGNSAYPSLAANMGTSAAIVSAGGNLVWTPNATTTTVATVVDWTSGYGVAGLPSSGLLQTRSN